MVTRRSHVTLPFAAFTALFAAGLTVAGCASSKKDASASVDAPGKTAIAQNSTAADPANVSPSGTPPQEPDATSADILARKTESYAQSLEPLIDQRSSPQVDARHPEVPLDAEAAPKAGQDVQWPAPPAGAVKPDRATANEGIAVREVPSPAPVVSKEGESKPVASNSIASNTISAIDPDAPLANVSRPDPTDTAIKAASTPPGAPGHNTTVIALANADSLDQKLAQRVKDDPLDPAAHLDFQLMRFVRGESTPEMSTLASLPQEDQQTLTVLLDGLTNYRSQLHAEANPLLSRKVKPLVDMADRFRALSDLDIQKIAVCREVQAFGVYEPMEPARFIAAKDKDYNAIIYCEVANFSSQLNDRSIWETKLRYSASLFQDTENGIEVWQGKPSEVLDMCRNRRKDFFIRDKIVLPATLPVGGYLFKVTIVDEQANRISEATVPIQIVVR